MGLRAGGHAGHAAAAVQLVDGTSHGSDAGMPPRILLFSLALTAAYAQGEASVDPRYTVAVQPDSQNGTRLLPTAATCANLIRLPAYALDEKDAFVRALDLSLTECDGMHLL